MGNPLDDMRTEISNKITTIDLVSSLMNSDNIEMKTEIVNPYALDTLKLFEYYLESHKSTLASSLINKWIELLLIYMVSNKRKSREEITKILMGYFTLEREKEKNINLTSNLAKQKETNEF